MKKLVSCTIAICLLMLFSNCTKQDRENNIINQESSIDKYLNDISSHEIIRNGGSNRAVIDLGKEGTAAAAGDSLYIRYAGYIFSNGKGDLFVTNDPEVAKSKNFPMQESPLGIKLGKTNLVKGLELGLSGVKEGEHCYIVFSAKYGFDNTTVGIVPKLSPLFYEVWVDKVIK